MKWQVKRMKWTYKSTILQWNSIMMTKLNHIHSFHIHSFLHERALWEKGLLNSLPHLWESFITFLHIVAFTPFSYPKDYVRISFKGKAIGVKEKVLPLYSCLQFFILTNLINSIGWNQSVTLGGFPNTRLLVDSDKWQVPWFCEDRISKRTQRGSGFILTSYNYRQFCQ